MSVLWTVLILLVAVVVTPVLDRVLGRSACWALAAMYLLAAGALVPASSAVLSGADDDPTAAFSAPWAPQWGVEFALRADGVGLVFAMIALVIGAVVLAYSARYLERGRQLSFSWGMTLFTLSMVALVLADDLVLLFICWELTSIASFLLIARSGTAGQAASMRTLLVTFLGGLSLLAAVSLMVMRLGTTSISEVLAADVWTRDPGFATLVGVLVALAACTKSAQFPFHVWLPDAMAAATPVSAYLHAAAVVKAGIFLLLRFSPAFHDVLAWNVLLVLAGLVTAFVGGFLALQQRDLKKLMAYSTVSQLGLIVTVIGVGTEAALLAAVLHTIAHALFKSGLFMMVGVVDHAAHTRELRRMPALARRMPGAFAVTLLGCLSMAGLPPMLGFVSKESLLTGALDAGGPSWVPWAVALGIAGASVLTFAYCAKIVLGAFVDGRDEGALTPADAGRESAGADGTDSSGAITDAAYAHRADPIMLWSAALPIAAGLPLAVVVGVLDLPVGRAVGAALGGAEVHPHLAFWHGLTLELGLTVGVIVLGAAIALGRRRLLPILEARVFPYDGARVLGAVDRLAERLAAQLVRPIASDDPLRHLGAILVAFATVVLASFAVLAGDLDPLTPGLNRPIDAVLLVLILSAVVLVCTRRDRLAATVALSAVGILVTVQLLALGAPDVALTQLLVESLTIIVIMLVLQKLPRRFDAPVRPRRAGTLLIAVLAGLAAAGGTFLFAGRRGRSEVAEYYIARTEEISGGHNIVNVILVEFRALDTLGELSVLGMAGVAIVAVLSSVRDRFIDPDDRPGAEAPLALREEGTSAHRAITSAWGNSAALQMMVRVTAPILAVISAMLFLRGHNAPGGGFIAALVGSAIVALLYLSTSRDRQVGPPRLPLLLIGGGVVVAVGGGILGFLGDGFLEPLHGYLLGVHLTSSMIFDAGVYLAVLGLVTVAVNLLGTSASSGSADDGEETRERTDETVEGELPGPLETTRGEPAPRRRRVGAGTSHLSTGTRPKESGRR
ncbi:DUF4040 family protein [Brachybacterium fresconis]|uniref:Multicomponent Na+:H+ antiporter subunit A n=1 Tax=Brachybacterium fresconis TaxID=173363 RepID=A0ABS4YKM0_9MICO|nr:DUF4040 family protein [Brachybacterium fresconis]MBP2409345.1 multicomponent Na+:H+ antiporter subunit A [Brachybacterium fresconis]